MVGIRKVLAPLLLSFLSVWGSVPAYAEPHLSGRDHEPEVEDVQSEGEESHEKSKGDSTAHAGSHIEENSRLRPGETLKFTHSKEAKPPVAKNEKQRGHTLWALLSSWKFIFFLVLAATATALLKTLPSWKKSKDHSSWENEDENKQEDEKKDNTTALIEDDKKEEEKKEKPRNKEEREKQETHQLEVTKENKNDDAKNNSGGNRNIIKESDEPRSKGDNRVRDRDKENENREDKEQKGQLSNEDSGGITPSEDIKDNKDRRQGEGIEMKGGPKPKKKSDSPIVSGQSKEHDKNNRTDRSSESLKTDRQENRGLNLNFIDRFDFSKLANFLSRSNPKSNNNIQPGGGTGSGMSVRSRGNKTTINSHTMNSRQPNVPTQQSLSLQGVNTSGGYTNLNITPNNPANKITSSKNSHDQNASSGVDLQPGQISSSAKMQSGTTPSAGMDDMQGPGAKQDATPENYENKDTSPSRARKLDNDGGNDDQPTQQAGDSKRDDAQKNKEEIEKDAETKKQGSLSTLKRIFSSAASSLVGKTGNLIKRGVTSAREKVVDFVLLTLSFPLPFS